MKARAVKTPFMRIGFARSVRGLLLLALGSAAAACRTPPAVHYYVLEPPRPAAEEPSPGASPEGISLGVESFTVDPPYDQERLVYRIGEDSPEVGFYAYHRWASPVGRLVAVAVAEALRGTPGIAAVEPATGDGDDYTAVLEGRVVCLEEVDLPAGQKARVRLELKLRDRAGTVLWARTLTGEAEGRAQSAAEIVEQMRRAFRTLLDELRAELSGVLSDPSLTNRSNQRDGSSRRTRVDRRSDQQ